jgi:hypothetical protein
MTELNDHLKLLFARAARRCIAAAARAPVRRDTHGQHRSTPIVQPRSRRPAIRGSC